MVDFFRDTVSYFHKEWGDRCTIDEENKTITMPMVGDHQTYKISCTVKGNVFNIVVICPIKIPQDKIAEACILANRINVASIPAFVVDPDNGVLAVTLDFYVMDSKLSNNTIKTNLFISVFSADKYYPAFEKVVSTDINARDTLKSVESVSKG